MWFVVNDFSYSVFAFCSPCSVCESRKKDTDGAMQPLHLFLRESISSISRNRLWSFLKNHQDMRNVSDIVVWKVGL